MRRRRFERKWLKGPAAERALWAEHKEMARHLGWLKVTARELKTLLDIDARLGALKTRAATDKGVNQHEYHDGTQEIEQLNARKKKILEKAKLRG